VVLLYWQNKEENPQLMLIIYQDFVSSAGGSWKFGCLRPLWPSLAAGTRRKRIIVRNPMTNPTLMQRLKTNSTAQFKILQISWYHIQILLII